MATRRPRGRGWWASSWATSNMSSRVSTWITPAWRNIASTAACGAPMRRTVWPIGTPWEVRPERTATIGLRCETRRAMRENLRGLPMDSRYIITTSVASSSSQYCRRSLPETSRGCRR